MGRWGGVEVLDFKHYATVTIHFTAYVKENLCFVLTETRLIDPHHTHYAH